MGIPCAASPLNETHEKNTPSDSPKISNANIADDSKNPDFTQSSVEYTARVGSISRRSRRIAKGPMEIFCSWIVEHQIGLSVNLLVLLSLTHICFPRARRHTRKFFELSYFNPATGEYRAGWNDAWMVFYWIVVFTGLRAAVMNYGLMTLAKTWGIKAKRDQTRFSEQAWLLIYYSIFWTLGMYIMINSDYWLNFQELWTGWPNREIGGLHKWYILVQYAFWLQQIMVINIEKRRKDHHQMFTHHIVTTLLIFTSYGYHQTRVANLILCIMDVVDLILPIAKCLKYLGFSTLCDFVFGFFMVIWFAARHVVYLMICWSVYADIPANIDYGCYRGKNGAIIGPFAAPDWFGHLLEPFHDPEGIVCWNDSIKWGFLSALLFLQGITLLWFWMIVQVALRVLRGGQADDSRSDEEDSDEEIFAEDPLLENEPNAESEVESIDLKRRLSNVGRSKYVRKSAGNATGVSLQGSCDRKEFLGRIGCDKGI
ncbi:TRAM1 Lag1 CLN8 superfamilz protein/sphingosine N-acyltransferase lag1 [Blumeria hordei DH14]|uniref:TRAM1 Lag1 CLN8 superfamilz protein/sphingosine N-acyltransferase lag1 n=1 Tax=Blumeria graminis f. sp. hordei (strain DH14) TaxID=546991 RepID=N1J9A8_BLUG1|nr:TRAM1 Lag1 CLN8 superfamilz protein/sphingosine N-acyltransferase lag1 [Blumeria hordei DH14]